MERLTNEEILITCTFCETKHNEFVLCLDEGLSSIPHTFIEYNRKFSDRGQWKDRRIRMYFSGKNYTGIDCTRDKIATIPD